MNADYLIIDDVIGTETAEPLNAEQREQLAKWASKHLPKITRTGEYRNKFGERVTWGASEDGTYVTVSTWPE